MDVTSLVLGKKYTDEKVTVVEQDLATHKINYATLVERLDDRIDVIITTPTDVVTVEEILDARQGELSLGANLTGVKAQITITNDKVKPLQYGELKMPVGFAPILPCKFYRDNDGLIKHNMDFNKYKGGTKIYVTDLGNDSTGTGTEALPYRTLKQAIIVAIAGVDLKYEIIISCALLGRDQIDFSQILTNKIIAITSITSTKTVVSANSTYVWTLDGTGTYQATRSGVMNCVDNLNRDLYGLPVPFLQVLTLAECQAQKGTWYTDTTTVWVHRTDEVIPTYANTIVNIGVVGLDAQIAVGGVLYFENFIFIGWNGNNALKAWTTSATPVGELCFNNCFFVGSKRLTAGGAGNGLSVIGVKNTYSFNCISAYNQLDGFNYHYPAISANEKRNCLALEYNCKGYESGLVYVGANSNQVSSMHEGATNLRIGTLGYSTTGGIIVDVNGCFSVLFDCHVHDSNSGFTSSSDNLGITGVMYLYNCSSKDAVSSIVAYNQVYLNHFECDGNLRVYPNGNQQGVINYI